MRAAFAQKRKTLANNLRAAGYTPAAIPAALSRASVPPQARAEALSLQDLAHLWTEIHMEKADPPTGSALVPGP